MCGESSICFEPKFGFRTGCRGRGQVGRDKFMEHLLYTKHSAFLFSTSQYFMKKPRPRGTEPPAPGRVLWTHSAIPRSFALLSPLPLPFRNRFPLQELPRTGSFTWFHLDTSATVGTLCSVPGHGPDPETRRPNAPRALPRPQAPTCWVVSASVSMHRVACLASHTGHHFMQNYCVCST